MKIKRIFNFICFFVVVPIAAFFSFDTLIRSFQIHQTIEKADSNFWEEFDTQNKNFNPYKHGAIPVNQNNKIISYWPTYPFLKDIFIISLVWTWLILAYRYLIKLFYSKQKSHGE